MRQTYPPSFIPKCISLCFYYRLALCAFVWKIICKLLKDICKKLRTFFWMPYSSVLIAFHVNSIYTYIYRNISKTRIIFRNDTCERSPYCDIKFNTFGILRYCNYYSFLVEAFISFQSSTNNWCFVVFQLAWISLQYGSQAETHWYEVFLPKLELWGFIFYIFIFICLSLFVQISPPDD